MELKHTSRFSVTDVVWNLGETWRNRYITFEWLNQLVSLVLIVVNKAWLCWRVGMSRLRCEDKGGWHPG